MDQLYALAPTPERDRCVSDPELDIARLIALRGGALAADERAEVDGHLARCPFCRDLLEGLADETPAASVTQLERALPQRSRSWAWSGGALAAAAAALVFVAWPESTAQPAEYELVGPRGAVASTRSGAGAGDFVRHSQVHLVVRPARPLAGAAPAARFFGARDGEPLRPVSPAVVRTAASGAYVLEGSGEAVFGRWPGAFTLYVVLAHDAAALDALAGGPPSALAVTAGLRWYSLPLSYRDGVAPDAD